MKSTLALLSASLIASGALAHRDMRLSLSPDGRVAELPAQYAATRIEVDFENNGSGRLTKLNFVSGGQRTVIKDCVLELVGDSNSSRMSLAGSWYHDEKLLPHYVHILFKNSSNRTDLPEDPGVQFLFSLRDARLLEVTQIVPIPKEQAVQHRNVKLQGGCPAK